MDLASLKKGGAKGTGQRGVNRGSERVSSKEGGLAKGEEEETKIQGRRGIEIGGEKGRTGGESMD